MLSVKLHIFQNKNIIKGKYFLILSQVGNGVKTDRLQTQYVDLGDLSAACMTNPVSCGISGGTVSLWVKSECDGGIISSAADGRQGFMVMCSGAVL